MTLVNDLGVDPHEWFVENDGSTGPLIPPPSSNPLDSMPIATDNPRPEEEIADWFTDNPDESDEIEKEKTMHQKIYEIATGGSENCDSDISCNIGGSENASRL